MFGANRQSTGTALRLRGEAERWRPSRYKGRTVTDSVPAEAPGQVTLREAEPGDTGACAQILFDAFGGLHDHHRFERTIELCYAIQSFAPFFAVDDWRLVVYASSVTYWPMNHGVSEGEDDMK